MIARLSDWWRERSQREQWLLGVMIGLLAIVLGWLLVIRPLQNGLESARIAHEAAIARLARVRADAASIERGGAAPSGPIQTVVSRTATEAGFVPSRLDPGSDGQVLLGLSSAKAVALAKWLQALEAAGVHVEQINIRPNSDATLSVDATLKGRSQ